MEIPLILVQFIGSLLAIIALAGLAAWLKLGPEPRLENEEQARFAADQAVSGYEPLAIGIDKKGRGAIMRDAAGRILLIRPHGSHFAGRLLSPAAKLSVVDDRLTVDTGERRYGAFTLRLGQPSAWVQAHRAIRDTINA